MLPYLLTAYFAFGPALVLSAYLTDDLGDESLSDQIGVALALIFVWPLMLALVVYETLSSRRAR